VTSAEIVERHKHHLLSVLLTAITSPKANPNIASIPMQEHMLFTQPPHFFLSFQYGHLSPFLFCWHRPTLVYIV
jgi:hypothetical protein